MLDLRAAIGELDLEELVLDRGSGDNGGAICGVALEGCAVVAALAQATLRGLRGRRGGLRLSDSGRLILWLGLGEEVLVAKERGEHNEHHCHGGAHIAPTTTASGALRLQIGIVNFGQRKLPIVLEGSPQGSRSTYGNGSWG